MSNIALSEADLNPLLIWEDPGAQGHSDANTKVQCLQGGAAKSQTSTPRACLASRLRNIPTTSSFFPIKGAGIEPAVIIRLGVCLKFPSLQESRKLLRL